MHSLPQRWERQVAAKAQSLPCCSRWPQLAFRCPCSLIAPHVPRPLSSSARAMQGSVECKIATLSLRRWYEADSGEVLLDGPPTCGFCTPVDGTSRSLMTSSHLTDGLWVGHPDAPPKTYLTLPPPPTVLTRSAPHWASTPGPPHCPSRIRSPSRGVSIKELDPTWLRSLFGVRGPERGVHSGHPAVRKVSGVNASAINTLSTATC